MRVLRFLLGLSTRVKITIALLVVAMGIFAIAYFEPHKLFIDEEVNEDFPVPVAVATTTAIPEATPVTEAPTTTFPPATTTTLDAAETSQAENRERGFSPASEEEKEQSPATTTSTTASPTTTTTVPPTTTTTTEAVPEGPVLLSSSEWISLGHPGTGTVLVPTTRRVARHPLRRPGRFQRTRPVGDPLRVAPGGRPERLLGGGICLPGRP